MIPSLLQETMYRISVVYKLKNELKIKVKES